MDKQNRVVVKIYGQEYTISGDQPSEHIIRVADYVDGKMTELAKSLPGVPAASVAALAAVNIADDYFGSIKIANEVRAQMAQLEREKNQLPINEKRKAADFVIENPGNSQLLTNLNSFLKFLKISD